VKFYRQWLNLCEDNKTQTINLQISVSRHKVIIKTSIDCPGPKPNPNTYHTGTSYGHDSHRNHFRLGPLPRFLLQAVFPFMFPLRVADTLVVLSLLQLLLLSLNLPVSGVPVPSWS
jgi:hypothetical protein